MMLDNARRRSMGSLSALETLEPRRLMSVATDTTAPTTPTAPASAVTFQSEPTLAASRQVSITLKAFPGTVKDGSNFYASVTPESGTVKGLVYFYADSQPIGAGWVVDGQAWMNTKHLGVGTHNVYAVYAGDVDHDRAASAGITHTVTTAAAPLGKALFGRWDWKGNGATRVIGLYAPGAAITATGTLTFHSSPNPANSAWKVTATLDQHGRADFGVIDPPDDLSVIYYTYSGDANYVAESNQIFIPNPYTPTSPAATGIVLSTNKSATNPKQPVTIKAFLQRPAGQSLSAAYTGTVQFWHEEMFLGTATVDASGVATFVASGTETGGTHVLNSEGLHWIRAVYSGDATHGRAEARIWHAVIPSAKLTRTTLTSDRTTARQDQPITFIATVRDVFNNPAGDKLGWVRLLDEWGKDILPGVRVAADGTATFIVHRLPVDTYGVRAVYQGTMGQDGYTPSKSITINTTITAGMISARPNITARITSVSTSRFPANLVVALAKSGSPIPTGRIAIYSQYDGNLLLGYADLDATGTVTTSFAPGLSKFYQKLRIVYLGDANYAPTEATFSLTPAYGYLEAKTPNDLPSSAALQFAADVNADGVKDLIYRDAATGAVFVKFINAAGATIGSKNLPAAAVANWGLDAGGDIDGDGDADLLWRHLATSRAYVWQLTPAGDLQSQGYVNSSGTAAGWRIVAAGDFNKDNRADIVWSNDLTGQRAVWLMNGRNVKGFTMFNHAPRDTAWIIDSIEDLDADGDMDLLWKNTKTSMTFGWLLTGTAVTGTTFAK
jgi:hypothetical protein